MTATVSHVGSHATNTTALHYIPFYTITLRNFVVPTLSMVGDLLSGNGCGSPNHILF